MTAIMSSYVSSGYSLTFMTWLKPGTRVQATWYLHWNNRSSYVVPRSRAGIFKINPIPFLIKEGRKELKRYGVIFTCLTSRAIHLEVSNTLDTDSFIHALRRFIARRGNLKNFTVATATLLERTRS